MELQRVGHDLVTSLSRFTFLYQCMKVKRESEVAQLCPTLHNSMDCSLLGSPIPGILQARTRVGCHFIFQCMKVKVLVIQSCPTSCNPMDCSLPGSPVHGILQARILEWVAVPFSRVSSQPKDRTQVSHIAIRFFTR